MYNIGGIAFNEYYIKSVELELETCDLTIKVIFHKDKKRIEREKHYIIKTDCNVDINELIRNLGNILKNE
jgi:hypothetical protein